MNRCASEDSVDDATELSEPCEEEIVREQILNVHFPAFASQKCRIVLTRSSLAIEEFKDEGDDENANGSDSELECIDEEFPIEDLYGFHIVQNQSEEPSIPSVHICLILYTKHSSETSQPQSVRRRVARVLEICEKGNSYEDNLSIAQEWAETIVKLVEQKCPKFYSHRRCQTGKPLDKRVEDAFKALRSRSSGNNERSGGGEEVVNRRIKLDFSGDTFILVKSILFERKFLVIVNPVSGQGKSTNLFQDHISPVLADCGIITDLRNTEYPHHAFALMSHFDLTSYDGIISIGGDGLLNEIVNGIRTRKDADKYVDIPIGIIATGSGNGLARSIASYCNVTEEEYKTEPVLHTTLSVARGCLVPVNLTEVTLDKRVFYSFLSVGWGILSDIDIESEVLRAIGEIRFFIWSFIRLAKLRRYKASLSYIPHDASGSIKGRVIVDDEFVSIYSACQSYIGSYMLFAPDAKPNDNIIHLTYLPSDTGRLATAKYLTELDRGQGNQINVDPGKYVKVKEFTIRNEGGIDGCLTVDGEQVKGEEITVRVCDSPLLMLAMG